MNRFSVTYRLRAGTLAEARVRAEAVAIEQTVEIPRAFVPPGPIEDEILGRVEALEPVAPGVFHASISYSPDSAGDEITQFLNVLFGNSSIQQGVRLIGLDLGPEMARRFPGPRLGIAGIRARCGRAQGGMIAPVLKPMGRSAQALAALAAGCVRGGADIVKEDHGLAGQPSAPFRPRVEAIARAVAEANRAEGRQTLYFPTISGHAEEIDANLRFAAEAGASGVLVMPGLFGFGLVHRIARDAGLGLAVMTHPSFLGPYMLAPDSGMDHGMTLGTIHRLAGADISVFPNAGGRFGFSAAECLQIVDACRTRRGPGRPMLPSPGGGMSVERAADMVQMFGRDVVYLLGGSLLADPPNIHLAVAAMRRAVDAAEAELAPDSPAPR